MPALIAGLNRTRRAIARFSEWLVEKFAAARFAKIAREFLIEVAVLVFVFPALDAIVKGDAALLHTVIPWSSVITVVCLLAAGIMSIIGGDS